MSRWLLIVAGALCFTGCSPDEDHHHRSTTQTAPGCASFTTCGTCTPVLGCGWCSFGDGAGKCASGPEACGSTFRWNWEPADCPAEADGGVVVDAPAEEVAIDSAPAETIEEASSECMTALPPTGCSITTGGSLCGAREYSVGCHGGATMTGCAAKASSGTSTYYCCPCR